MLIKNQTYYIFLSADRFSKHTEVALVMSFSGWEHIQPQAWNEAISYMMKPRDLLLRQELSRLAVSAV